MGTYNRSNSFTEEINEIKSELQNFKSVQFSGSDIYTNKKIPYSQNIYDIIISSNGSTPLGDMYMFTSNKQAQPYAIIYTEAFNNELGTIKTDINTYSNINRLEAYAITGNVLYFTIDINNNNNFDIYIKLYVIASDNGVFKHLYD